jgi:hypothetical protein
MNRNSEFLAEVTTRTLEELCFLFPMPLLSDEQRDAATDASMSVRFEGPVCGRLVVRVCGGMLELLASNMLGDAIGDGHMQRDALAEVANVVCGNLLPLIGGTDAEFSLAAPQPIVVLSNVRPVPDAMVQFGLEQTGRADVFLYLDAA